MQNAKGEVRCFAQRPEPLSRVRAPGTAEYRAPHARRRHAQGAQRACGAAVRPRGSSTKPAGSSAFATKAVTSSTIDAPSGDRELGTGAERTLDAMRAGAYVIYQGVLIEDGWHGIGRLSPCAPIRRPCRLGLELRGIGYEARTARSKPLLRPATVLLQCTARAAAGTRSRADARHSRARGHARGGVRKDSCRTLRSGIMGVSSFEHAPIPGVGVCRSRRKPRFAVAKLVGTSEAA